MKKFLPSEKEARQEIAEEIEFLRETLDLVRTGKELEEHNRPSEESLSLHGYIVGRCLDSAEDLLLGRPRTPPLTHAEALVEAARFRLLVVTHLTAVLRDESRINALKKPRFSDCNQWIDQQLAADPDAKSPDLWARAPDWITDRIGSERFRKRVTAARKRRK